MPAVQNPALEDLLPENAQTINGVSGDILSPSNTTLQDQSGQPAADTTIAPDLLPSNQPTLRTVQSNETVQGQLTNLLDDGSPVMEQARDQTQTAHARRGGQNMLMASQAGEQALISKALEIATPDAQTYARAAEGNQQAQNVFEKAELDYQQTYQINKQTQKHARDMSAQEFDQNIGMIKANHAATIQQLGQELINAGILSSQQHGELLEALTAEHANTMDRLAEDYALRSAELTQQLGNRLIEIDSQAAAQFQLDAAADNRRLQLQYLQESGAIMRQAMQDIAQINTTEGLSASAQRAAVNDVNSKLQADLGLLATYYQTVPGWQSQWGGNSDSSGGGADNGSSGGGTTAGGDYNPYGGSGSSAGGSGSGDVFTGGFGNINIAQGDNPPSNPPVGQLWSDGSSLRRYDGSDAGWQRFDTDSSAWVADDVYGNGSGSGSGGTGGDDGGSNSAYANTSNPNFNPDQPYTVANKFPNPIEGTPPSGYSLLTDGSDWNSSVTVPPGNGGEAWGYSTDGSSRLVELGRTADGNWRVVYPPSLATEDPSQDSSLGVNPGTGNEFSASTVQKYAAANPNWDENSNNKIDPDEWASYQLSRPAAEMNSGPAETQRQFYDALVSGIPKLSNQRAGAIQQLITQLWPGGRP